MLAQYSSNNKKVIARNEETVAHYSVKGIVIRKITMRSWVFK